MLEGENDDLRAKIKELMEESKSLRNEIRSLREINITSAAKINKTLVHRELISKDLINNDPSSILTKNYSTAFCSFGDVVRFFFGRESSLMNFFNSLKNNIWCLLKLREWLNMLINGWLLLE